MTSSKGLSITNVSKKFAITSDTLRYYERIGLLPPVHRNMSGIREYLEEDLNWVEFIVCMRKAGLSIESLVDYVALFQEGGSTVQARKDLLIEERRRLVEKLEAMQQTLQLLDKKLDGYEERMLNKEKVLKKK